MSGAGVLALWFLLAVVRGEMYVTRRHPVDTFSLRGSCHGGRGCLARSMGTALELSTDGCTCACAPHLPTFREDLQICVDDLHDCPLIPFVSGTTYQKIPFVFLPLKGQIIYPSAELVFAGVESPICIVSSAKFLSPNGWDELRNMTDAEPPFRLFRDDGRTLLQWLGDGELRQNLEGRLILIHLMCKDMVDEQSPDNNIFTSCISFRVAGTPSEIISKSGVKEVTFSVDSQQNSQNGGSSYIVIAVSSVMLGLVYIVSILLYLHGKKKKKIKYLEHNNDPLTVAEEGIVKNNPLLKHCHENMAYHSDAPSGSDSEDGGDLSPPSDDTGAHKVQTTSALIHPCSKDKEKKITESCYQLLEAPNMERLPEEGVSIIETLDYREDGPETVRVIACTNGRRKLYFNPAYFEPELLLAPPPAAIEFLTKIREVISIAKAKMEAKRFLPSLMGIPEENDYALHKASSLAGTESTVILRADYKRYKYERNNEQACHVCCRNTEQKQTSIQKWLENVPTARTEDETTSTCSSSKNKRAKNRRKSPLSIKISEPMVNDSTNNNLLYENNEVTSSKAENPKSNKFNTNLCSGINEQPKMERNGSNSPTNINGKQNDFVELSKLDLNNDLSSTLNQLNDTSYLNISSTDSCSINNKVKSIDLIKHKNDIASINTGGKIKEARNEDNTSNLSNNEPKKCVDNKSELLNKINNAFTSKCTNVFDHKHQKNLNNNVYQNRDDHAYETIMAQKNEEAETLPDFITKPNGYSLVSEVYVNDGYDYISESSHSNLSSLNSNGSDDEVEYDRNSLGHLTIKVKDNPALICSNDSDSFEPDTLDRKPNKLKINQEISINIEKNQDIYADSLERPQHISLKSTGTFKNGSQLNNLEGKNAKYPLNRAFGSLREIFEAKTKYNQCTHNKSIKSCSPAGSLKSFANDGETYKARSWKRGKPKLLRPEGKHTRRQRDPSPPNHSKTLIPPITSPASESHSGNLPKKEGCPPLPPRLLKPPLPPKNGSVRSSNHEAVLQTHHISTQSHGYKTSRFMDIASESSEYEPLGSQEYSCYKLHTLNTESNSGKENKVTQDNCNKNNQRTILHLQNRTEDSGYLSTDSNDSHTVRKRDDSISETDDSFFDGASESGAESIATDSFFFGRE